VNSISSVCPQSAGARAEHQFQGRHARRRQRRRRSRACEHAFAPAAREICRLTTDIPRPPVRLGNRQRPPRTPVPRVTPHGPPLSSPVIVGLVVGRRKRGPVEFRGARFEPGTAVLCSARSKARTSFRHMSLSLPVQARQIDRRHHCRRRLTTRSDPADPSAASAAGADTGSPFHRRPARQRLVLGSLSARYSRIARLPRSAHSAVPGLS
jgi:hypothetical protein